MGKVLKVHDRYWNMDLVKAPGHLYFNGNAEGEFSARMSQLMDLGLHNHTLHAGPCSCVGWNSSCPPALWTVASEG